MSGKDGGFRNSGFEISARFWQFRTGRLIAASRRVAGDNFPVSDSFATPLCYHLFLPSSEWFALWKVYRNHPFRAVECRWVHLGQKQKSIANDHWAEISHRCFGWN